MAEGRYEERYCAFIDILGFSELIKRLGAGETPFLFLKELLSKIHNPPKPRGGALTYAISDFQVQSISDAVAISTTPNSYGLLQIIESLTELTRALLLEGYFIRGAIVKGKLYHDNKMVFGEALVKAYNLEQNVVRYPRIMVASDVVTQAASDDDIGELVDELLKPSDDGPYYVNTLRDLATYLRRRESGNIKGKEVDDAFAMWAAIQEKIEERFSEATDVPRHFQNVQWFANYWNETVDPIGGKIIMHINGPGLKWYLPPAVNNRISN